MFNRDDDSRLLNLNQNWVLESSIMTKLSQMKLSTIVESSDAYLIRPEPS